jgi:hypothetical protein
MILTKDLVATTLIIRLMVALHKPNHFQFGTRTGETLLAESIDFDCVEMTDTELVLMAVRLG